MTPIAPILEVAAQTATAAVVGWLIHKLGSARKQFDKFMSEHEFLLTTAKTNAEAVIALNKRLDRHVRKHG
jgi:hypothetical protein